MAGRRRDGEGGRRGGRRPRGVGTGADATEPAPAALRGGGRRRDLTHVSPDRLLQESATWGAACLQPNTRLSFVPGPGDTFAGTAEGQTPVLKVLNTGTLCSRSWLDGAFSDQDPPGDRFGFQGQGEIDQP